MYNGKLQDLTEHALVVQLLEGGKNRRDARCEVWGLAVQELVSFRGEGASWMGVETRNETGGRGATLNWNWT